MSEDEKKLILADLEEQGFPLEVETSEALKSFDWNITNQADYTDSESGKRRSIDIIAEKNVLMKLGEMGFDLNLIVDCKKSSKPWVFYTSDFRIEDIMTRIKMLSSSQISISPEPPEELFVLMLNGFLLKSHLTSCKFRKLAFIPFEPFTEGKGKSIHKARMQVCNAILSRKERERGMKGIFFPFGKILMPVIVLDAHLYSYENGNLELERGLLYYFPYADSFFLIEIVTKSFLNSYLEGIETEIKNFKRNTQACIRKRGS